MTRLVILTLKTFFKTYWSDSSTRMSQSFEQPVQQYSLRRESNFPSSCGSRAAKNTRHFWLIVCTSYAPLTILRLAFAEPKKEKTDGAAQNGALSPNGDTPQHVGQPPGAMEATPPVAKPERPSSLGHGKQLTKRLLCYHSEHCKFDM